MDRIPKTCKAAVLEDFNKPLKIREVRVPDTLEPGAILVRLEVASICGSDVHLWEGLIQGLMPIKLPIILGHEMCGQIVKLGEGVTQDSVGQPLKLGDRIVWTHASCGECYFCRIRNQPTLCSNRRYYMFSCCEEFPYLMGGFSEYIYVFPRSGRVRVPDEVSSEFASCSSCAFRTVVHTFERLGTLEDMDTVIIQGAGPLGLYSVAMAIKAGVSKIIILGAPAQRLAVAKKWGADHIIDIDEVPEPEKRIKQVLELTNGMGADVVIEVSGGSTAFKEGLGMVRRGGKYMIVGQVGGPPLPIQPEIITYKHLTITGVLSGDVPHFYKALQFIKNNQNRFDFNDLISNRYRLDQINEALVAMKGYKEIKPLVMPNLA